jgi:transcriptional regulator with XRE-family HTH domain
MAAKDRKARNWPELNSDEQLRKLGERIRQLRIDAGFSSYEYFAYEHNFSRAQMGRYEKGQDLRFTSLVRLVSAFGITLEEFFSEGFD